jgi:hypothetical protein
MAAKKSEPQQRATRQVYAEPPGIDDKLEEIRNKCERRAAAEKAGDDSVKRNGEKARKAADRAVSVE